MGKLPVIQLTGTAYELGLQHGQRYAGAIREFTAERVRLSSDPYWTAGYDMTREMALALGEACLTDHRAYAPELIEELEGIADATGLTLAELIIMNGFTDFVDLIYSVARQQRQPESARAIDDCTAFIVPDNATSDGHGFLGQTWDMHPSAGPYVILLEGKPTDGRPAFLSFSTAGCVGMIGLNDAGIAVGINNIMGGDGQVGVTWPFVIRKALAQTTLTDALACITSAKLAGAHNYLLFDHHGDGYNVEVMATRHTVEELHGEVMIHTNHCLMPSNHEVERHRPPESQASSEARLAQGRALLGQRPITEHTLMEVTRDEEAICVQADSPSSHVATCGAAIMRPATGDFWAVYGLPTENTYEHFTV